MQVCTDHTQASWIEKVKPLLQKVILNLPILSPSEVTVLQDSPSVRYTSFSRFIAAVIQELLSNPLKSLNSITSNSGAVTPESRFKGLSSITAPYNYTRISGHTRPCSKPKARSSVLCCGLPVPACLSH